jgi:hypothetical protein
MELQNEPSPFLIRELQKPHYFSLSKSCAVVPAVVETIFMVKVLPVV